MNGSLPDIYTYIDFKKYLEDYRAMRKGWEDGFTHTYICYRLGQKNSKSYFSNVVNGLKVVTQEFINRFIEVLELKAEEAVYFRALVSYNQTCNLREKEYYLEQLLRQKSSHRVITEKEYALYKEWHHGVVKAILDIYDFDRDYKRLAAMVLPPITVQQAQKSVKLLDSLGLIKKDARGYYKPTEKTIKTAEYVRDELIKHYQVHCLEMAKTMLMGNDSQPRDYSTNILSVSGEGLKKVQAHLRKFRDEIRSIVQNDPGRADRVYQMDIQLFPNSNLAASQK